MSLVTLIGLDEGVLVALEESVPQLFLILLAQPELDGPVMAMWIGIHVPDEGACHGQGREILDAKVSAKWISLGKGVRQAGHDETSKGEAVSDIPHLI